MNNVQLVGRVGKDPEVFTFENGNKKTSFTVATNDSYKDKKGEWVETTAWHNIVIFRETKLQKGDLVEITGKITNRSYDDKDGNKRYVTEIVARTAKPLSGQRKADSEQKTAVNNEATGDGLPKDDLPF